MKLSVCVLTYNQPELLAACLPSIPRWAGTEYLVIDNGSPYKERVAEIARQNGFEVRRVEENRGQIHGQNLCFEMTQGDWVLFISDDVECWDLKPLKDDGEAQISPIIYEPTLNRANHGLIWMWPGYGITATNDRAYTDCIPSICYFMRRSAWQTVGGFDESLGSSHEDIDMGLRLRQAGYQLGWYKNSRVLHRANGTLRSTLLNPSEKFQEARLKVIRKHYRGVDRWARLLAVRLVYYLCSHFRKTQ